MIVSDMLNSNLSGDIESLLTSPEELEEIRRKAEAKRIAEELFHINNTPINKIKLPNRNDKCPCGSGKKYKNCCMEIDQQLINKIESRK